MCGHMRRAGRVIVDTGPDHKGLLVCDECIDEPHPKKLLRPDNLSHGAKCRPYDESGFTGCSTLSAVPDFAIPDCMIPDQEGGL